MIKVLHLTYDMRIGGTEMVIKNLIKGNTYPSIEMSIYCIESPLGPWGKELEASGIKITSDERQPQLDFKLIRKLRKHIKKNEIDILHCHQYTPWVYGALAAAFTNTKVIFTEHGRFYPDSASWKRKLINPVLRLLTSAITAISKATKDALVAFEYLKNTDINVVYNGIEPLEPTDKQLKALRLSLNLPTDSFIFGTIARLDPIKNQSMLINAFADAEKHINNAYLLIVGDGELMTSLNQQVAHLGLQSKVIFTGYKPSPANYLALMDVFLLPSLSEGTSMTLLEAMSIGKPCIVTNAGGNPEIIKHRETGLVTGNDNQKELKEALVEISESEQMRASFSENAIARFHELFHVNKMMAQYSIIYKKVLDN